MIKYTNTSPEETLVRQEAKAHAFLERVLKANRRQTTNSKRRQRFRALLGHGGMTPSPLLSDVTVRVEAAKILFDVTRHYLPDLVPEGTPMHHITFVDDIGLTSDRRPNLQVAALKRKVDKAMRVLGVSGIVMVEVQALTNYHSEGEGRTLMLHAHALCWGKISRRMFRGAKNKINNSRSWNNHFGAMPVHSRALKNFDEALKIVCYLAKLPHDGKYRTQKSKDKFCFRPTLKGYPNSMALRIAEGLSHYEVYEAVFSVGDGKEIRKHWKRQLTDWYRERLSTAEPDDVHEFNVAKFWRRVHKAAGNPLYEPYIVQ